MEKKKVKKKTTIKQTTKKVVKKPSVKKNTPKTKRKKTKIGFTLIELLAVIIILGIIMVIAVPSVTTYISSSRKKTYVTTAKEIVSGAKTKVNEGELEMYDTNTTYYIPSKFVQTEGSSRSPYGEFVSAYIGVTYNTRGYKYYWISVDETGQGIDNLTLIDNLDPNDIHNNIKSDDIENAIQTTGIGNRSKIKIYNVETSSWTDYEAKNNVGEEGGSIRGGSQSNKAASVLLSAGKSSNQLNKISGTNIYIFKGGRINQPYNYINFNGEIWRAIGIYNGQLKIIRAGNNGVVSEPLGYSRIQWNSTSANPVWATSSLNERLNTTYYNTLSDTAKNMIDENGKWDVGPVIYNATASDSYTASTTTGTVIDNVTHTTPWTAKVGIIASYEYLYAAGLDSCLTTNGYNFGYNTGLECGRQDNNWLRTSSEAWTLSPYNGVSPYNGKANYAIYIHSTGAVNADPITNYYAIIPVVYLKSDVKVASGDGKSPSTAYVLE